jgi:hypothetical protein
MRAPKKSETLEIRLPHAAKHAFMDQCRADGLSASEALRDFIESYLEPPSAPRMQKRSWRWIAAGLSALALGAIAAPSLARPSLPGEFERLDIDGSRMISFQEFSNAASLTVAVSVGSLHQVRADVGLREALVRQEFERIDADHDGLISLDEFRRYYGD